MSLTETSEPIYYNSLYYHGVDDKRRVQVPAKWRVEGQDNKFTIVLWKKGPEDEACLLVMPPPIIKGLVDKLSAMPFSDPKAESLRRLLGSFSDQVSLDKGGRICIPENMAKAAGIEAEAVLVGMFDRFQIWNPKRYEATSASDSKLSSEAYGLI